jgi:tetratricopeptide (TPR) repeat protein/predicted Ser/Thr protein kinase
MSDLTGTILDTYDIQRVLGRGGMGTVYLAYDRSLGREVAIKVLAENLAQDPRCVEDFRVEATAAARIVSPYVTTIYSVAEIDGGPIIVMEYVRGESLRALIARRGALPAEEILEVGTQIVDALRAAHEQGVVHRDIKPDNVLISDNGVAKVMDFGIARVAGSDAKGDARDAGPVGTAAYMAPEQSKGMSDHRADLYALGAVMYEMATARLPFEAESPEAVIARKLSDVPVLPNRLGADLPPALERLIMKLLERDPGLRPADAQSVHASLREIAKAGMAARTTPRTGRGRRQRSTGDFRAELVGRQAEMNVAIDALERASLSSGRTLLIGGEAGVGKTRLLDEVARAALERDFLVLSGACLSRDAAVPYFPFLAAVRSVLEAPASQSPGREEIRAVLREEAAELSLLVPYLGTSIARSVSGGTETTSEPRGGREGIFDALTELIRRLASQSPVLLTLDDVHWIDASSLHLLHHLARSTREAPVLLAASYRPDEIAAGAGELSDALARLRVEDGVTELVLQRLDPPQFTDLLHELLHQPLFTEEFVRSLYQQTQGNPLFTVELLKAMRDEGLLVEEKGRWVSTEDVVGIRMPRKVREAVERRIDRLSADERAILECAAVQGKTFVSEIVSEVLGTDRLLLLRTLQSLERTHQIVRYEGKSYRFDHPLLWDSLYESISDELRREYHLRIAGALETRHAKDPTPVLYLLADHYYKAGDFARALPYLERAGERAMALFAHDEALGHYTRALECLEHTADGAGSVEGVLQIRKELGKICLALGRLDAALQNYEVAQGLCQAYGDDPGAARFTKLMGDVEFSRSNWEAALRLYEEAGGIYLALSDLQGQADVFRSMGNVYFERGELAQVLEYYGRTLALGEQADDPQLVARACNNLGATANVMGERQKAIEYYRRSMENYKRAEDKFGEAQTFHNIGMTYAELHNWAEAVNFYRRSVAVSEDMQETELLAISRLALAEAEARLGQLDQADANCHRAMATFISRNDRLGTADSYRVWGLIAALSGRGDEAEQHFQECLRVCDEIGGRLQAAECQRDYAAYLLTQGQTEEARVLLEVARITFDELSAREHAADVERTLNALDAQPEDAAA